MVLAHELAAWALGVLEGKYSLKVAKWELKQQLKTTSAITVQDGVGNDIELTVCEPMDHCAFLKQQKARAMQISMSLEGKGQR